MYKSTEFKTFHGTLLKFLNWNYLYNLFHFCETEHCLKNHNFPEYIQWKCIVIHSETIMSIKLAGVSLFW